MGSKTDYTLGEDKNFGIKQEAYKKLTLQILTIAASSDDPPSSIEISRLKTNYPLQDLKGGNIQGKLPVLQITWAYMRLNDQLLRLL